MIFKFGKLRSEELFWWVFLFNLPFLFNPIDGTATVLQQTLNAPLFLSATPVNVCMCCINHWISNTVSVF